MNLRQVELASTLYSTVYIFSCDYITRIFILTTLVQRVTSLLSVLFYWFKGYNISILVSDSLLDIFKSHSYKLSSTLLLTKAYYFTFTRYIWVPIYTILLSIMFSYSSKSYSSLSFSFFISSLSNLLCFIKCSYTFDPINEVTLVMSSLFAVLLFSLFILFGSSSWTPSTKLVIG